MKYLIVVFFPFCFANCFSQTLDANVTILFTESNKLYAGKSNLIGVMYNVDSFQNILVTASQGEVKSTDKYLHHLDLKNTGQVLISVFNISGEKTILLNQKIFPVVPVKLSSQEKLRNKITERCQITIEGFSGHNVPISVIRKATQFTIKAPYNIKSMVLYIGKRDLFTYHLTSGKFDSGLDSIWTRITPGMTISLEEVVVSDGQNRFYKINGNTFLVSED